MAVTAGFRWETAPSGQLIPNLASYEQRLIAAIGALADLFAARMEAAAKAGAPWTDRTGAARQGLRGFAEKEATRVVIWLVHGVRPYGVYLELGTSKTRPYPIIMPVLQAHYGPIMAAVRQLVGT